MSVTLFTPGTGFPDLEAKIAYGLARIAIEANWHFNLIPEKGFYKIEILEGSLEKFNPTFIILLNRILSSDKFFDLGVKAKDKGKYSVKPEILNNLNSINLFSLFKSISPLELSIKKDFFCGHSSIPKFGGSSGLILISSFHAGKPYEREKRGATFNQNLCAVCGYLAVLGLYSFAIKVQMGFGKNKKYVIVLPIPKNVLRGKDLQMLLALQKTLHNFWLSDIQPLRTFTIGLLARVPSINDVINELEIFLHVSLLSRDARGDTVVEQTEIIDAIRLSKFIAASPFNSSTVEKLLGNNYEFPKVSSLIELNNFIEKGKFDNLAKFARSYVKDTSNDKFTNLLYPETVKYLLKEVGMIDRKFIENSALSSLANTLRYFIKQKKYGYADDIRNSRKNSKEFEETIAKMLREGRLRLEQGDNIHLPTEAEIQEVFRLANEDFEATKTALVILAFSFPSRTN